MRFLCLHGKGTNNKVFEMQTAAIRYELGDNHVFEFVEGTVSHAIAPEIEPLVSEHEECFSYFDENSASSCIDALDDLEDYIAAEGPFDAVMAFSQGAHLAATFMARGLQLKPVQQRINPLFRCAIFFSGGSPCDPAALRKKELRPFSYDTDGEVINVPTAHIWGSNDQQFPNHGPVLSLLCKRETRTVFIHQGRHEIPGSSSKDAVTATVHAIRRTVAKAAVTQ